MSFLLKRAPLWALVLAVLATAGTVTWAYVAVPQMSDSAQVLRDFSITASPSSMTMNQGSSATAIVTVASVNGFDLATGLSTIVSPAGVGLTALLSLNVVTPSSQSTASSILTLTSQTATPV